MTPIGREARGGCRRSETVSPARVEQCHINKVPVRYGTRRKLLRKLASLAEIMWLKARFDLRRQRSGCVARIKGSDRMAKKTKERKSGKKGKEGSEKGRKEDEKVNTSSVRPKSPDIFQRNSGTFNVRDSWVKHESAVNLTAKLATSPNRFSPRTIATYNR